MNEGARQIGAAPAMEERGPGALGEALRIILMAAVPAVIAFCIHRDCREVGLALADVRPIRLEEIVHLPHEEVLWIDGRSHRRFAAARITGAVWLSTNQVDRARDLAAAWRTGRLPVVYGDGADWRDLREAGAMAWESLPGRPPVRVLDARWDELPGSLIERKGGGP